MVMWRSFLVSLCLAAAVSGALDVTGGAKIPEAATTSAYTLNNGVAMPKLGLGTMGLRKASGQEVMTLALNMGYRLLDTAKVYGNHKDIAVVLKKTNVPRKDIFITTKIPPDDCSDPLKLPFILDACLIELGTEYVDLLLIHAPEGLSDDQLKAAWKVFESFVDAKKVRAIGVSNFAAAQMKVIVDSAKVKPAVNQIYFTPYNFHEKEPAMNETLAFQKEHNIITTAYGSIDSLNLEKGPTLPIAKRIGQEKNKTYAQVGLRWALDNGASVIPKTKSTARLLENAQIFDFSLSAAELAELSNYTAPQRDEEEEDEQEDPDDDAFQQQSGDGADEEEEYYRRGQDDGTGYGPDDEEEDEEMFGGDGAGGDGAGDAGDAGYGRGGYRDEL